MKHIQVLLIIFCLGIFLIPKDHFYAQTSQENCCKKKSSIKSCCEKNHKSHDKKDQKSSCNDDSCSSCMSCSSCIVNISDKIIYAVHPMFAADHHSLFQYSDPYISDRLKDIWQPPKLG